MSREVRHDATVQVRRGPRKVKSSFSLRTPCVTSLRVDDGIPVAWQRLVRPWSKKRGHGRLDPLFRLSGSTLFSPNHLPPSPASFLPTGWLYSLAPLDSSPSGRRHLNWTAAIAVAPSVAPFSLPTKIWTRVRKSLILFKSTLLLRSCIFQKLLSSKTIVVCRNRNLQMSLTLWTRFIARFM